ncbi:Hypothetical Protein FCC1311_078122 [Hondaea fermentalgiana]|uniref:Major facilitator superfamily (MFS) profile domain-containing protein n=1 Tax=Hondaea fermentalgiana TaxID=2315210 RepID=A0A2R5GL27_9STRA|nr:Hypothetical Protein FCC1311_078122 [Hondaea fermentalgiana]|eukprot:GBG31587.1 Hypothetical Protein FCC1311_078122 [Hondaea fermentalgiana]
MRKMLSRFVLVTLLEKLLVYTSVRVVYPLVNYLGDDWGLTREEMGYVLAAGEVAAIPAGLIAAMGDRVGNRVVAISAWYVFLAGSLMILAPSSLALIVCARVLVSLFGTLFLTVSQSSLVEQTDDSAIGFVTGITEMGWGFSILVLVPILTVVYEHTGWRPMFGILSALIAPLCIEVYRKYPKDARFAHTVRTEHNAPAAAASPLHGDDDQTKGTSRGSIFRGLSSLRKSTYWTCLFMTGPLLFNLSSLIFNTGHNVMFLAFADWAYEYYDVEAEKMGAASFAIGATEMIGDLLVIFIGDRVGLMRLTKIASVLFAFFVGMFILAADHSLAAGIALAALLFLPGETFIVAQIALAEKFVPQHLRTTMLGINFQCHFLGRAIGAFIAESLWKNGEILSTSLLGIGAAVVSLILVCAAHPYLPQTNSTNSNDVENDDANEDQSNDSGSPQETADIEEKSLVAT